MSTTWKPRLRGISVPIGLALLWLALARATAIDAQTPTPPQVTFSKDVVPMRS
jgi:hypothetical protein